MDRKILKNKPLVEAILEVRWKLQERAPGIYYDPCYKILMGRLYDRLYSHYPYPVELPTSAMPDEISNYVVKQQFRKAKDEWPLIQIGPGILTLNDTKSYVWEDFEGRIRELIKALFESYPDKDKKIEISGLSLRYIDAIEFDGLPKGLFSFLREHMGVKIELNDRLFDDGSIKNDLVDTDLRLVYPTSIPEGYITIRFLLGQKNISQERILIWETHMQSRENISFKEQNDIIDWIIKAHDITDKCFFSMLDEELMRRFE